MIKRAKKRVPDYQKPNHKTTKWLCYDDVLTIFLKNVACCIMILNYIFYKIICLETVLLLVDDKIIATLCLLFKQSNPKKGN